MLPGDDDKKKSMLDIVVFDEDNFMIYNNEKDVVHEKYMAYDM